MSSKKKILIIQKVHDKGMELINNHPNFDVEVTDDTSVENLKLKLKNCDGASIRIAKLPGEVIEEAKNLKIISRHGVGYDNIDLKKAKEKDIKIAITANANAVTVAEHVMFVLLNIAKRKDLFDKTVREGNFKDRNKLPKTIEVAAIIISTYIILTFLCSFFYWSSEGEIQLKKPAASNRLRISSTIPGDGVLRGSL